MKKRYSKEIDILYDAQIFVAGGGPAGVAAAVAAARQGKKVILAEQTGSLGGASVNAMVAGFMNFDDGENFICSGIGREIFDVLFKECRYKREWYNIHPERLKRLYDDMAAKAGVKILFYSRVADVVVKDGHIEYAVISGAEGLYAVTAEVYIDCTGNGGFSFLAGAEYEYGDDKGVTMPATICSLWGGVDFSKKPSDEACMIEKAYADGVFSQYDSMLPGIHPNFPDIGVGEGNVGHCFGVDDRDTESLTAAMLEGRKRLEEYERYYKSYIPGCESSELIKSADFIGVRESRRISCLYTLTFESFFSGESFYDEIGRYSYPIDIHPMRPDKESMEEFDKNVSIRHGRGESYSIPYRSLVPVGFSNLLVAGMCIGCDHMMQASVRVIPGCYITGQAAGTAAAVCVEDGSAAADADIKKIRKILKDSGAYLKV